MPHLFPVVLLRPPSVAACATPAGRDAEVVVGPTGRQTLKPSAATLKQKRLPRARVQTLAERLEWQRQYEIEDPFAKEIAADLVRQVVMAWAVWGRPGLLLVNWLKSPPPDQSGGPDHPAPRLPFCRTRDGGPRPPC